MDDKYARWSCAQVIDWARTISQSGKPNELTACRRAKVREISHSVLLRMPFPVKRKRDSSPKPTGAVTRGSNNLGGGEHTIRGRSTGRSRDRGRGRGRSFHIPRNAPQTALLTEVWKHRTRGTYCLSSQSGPVPPSSHAPPSHTPQPDGIAKTPQPPHGSAEDTQYHNLDDFFNSSGHQNTQSIHLRKVRPLNGPLRQIHRNKRQNQASAWTDRMIPLLLGPFMDLLQRTRSGRVFPPTAPQDAACSCSSVALKITCVSWNRLCSFYSNCAIINCVLQALKTALSLPVVVAQPLSNS